MTSSHVEAIRHSSWKLYLYDHGSHAERSDATTTALVSDLGDRRAWLQLFRGSLPQSIQCELVRRLLLMGFAQAKFEVPEGTQVTRYAQFVETVDGFDHYRLDLIALRTELENIDAASA